MRRIRCAIYTRKSSEDGLEQDFNSLDAQREACEAYIASQKHEGWELVPEHFDDGGISGGHLDRPALQQLMQAVGEKRVDQIVVYKIDRLTRSLTDFARLVDRLDAVEASFVSVTQAFNTATSMGRLTLNMLLSFAQFEREVTAERIRDKIAASKRKGLWMGGTVPLGYRADGRSLKIDDVEADTIRTLYTLYLEHRTLRETKRAADARGLRSRKRERTDGRVTGGNPIDRGHLHHILSNPIYAGRIRHKGQVYDGQHQAIIAPDLWDEVQRLLADGAARARGSKGKATRSSLAGKLFDETGDRLTPSHSRKNGKRLRYYISRRLVIDRKQNHPDAWRLPADQLERLLAEVVQQHLNRPEAATALTLDLGAPKVAAISASLAKPMKARRYLALIERADLKPGKITILLGRGALSALLGCSMANINEVELTLEALFQMRRRGVELKLHLGDAPSEIDQTLVRNIVKARRWLGMITEGRPIADIAQTEGLSNRRIQDLMPLAFLSPDLLEAIASGEQPIGLTTDYLIKTGFPTVWSQQRPQFAAL
ncbi:MAG TPA: recombinase family protein [Octadecabacter sp.]|nr:recombinase family protein [Octadecabacter sp.]